MDEPVIACDRCKQPGGLAHRGWHLLCEECVREDNMEFWEDKLDPWEH